MDMHYMAARVELELQTRSFATTAITAFELRAGAKTTRQAAAVGRNRKHFERVEELRLSGRYE